MFNRSIVTMILLMIVTLGIYTIVWLVKTKNEMVRKGADIPTAWLLIVPIVSIWWHWKFSGGVEHVTNGKMSQVIAFIVLFLLAPIAILIVQSEFNKIPDVSTVQ